MNEDFNKANGNLLNDTSGIFNDLMNEGSTYINPEVVQEYGYADDHDFETFQNESSATRIVEDTGGYMDLPLDIMGDETTEDNTPLVNNSLITEVLKSRGINPDSIKFENEDGQIESQSFNNLSKEDQIELLNSTYEVDEEGYGGDYSEDEIEAIEFLRGQNMTIRELAQEIRQKTIEEMQSSMEPSYSVDEFSDDELFIVDFRNKYGDDFTDEELIIELDRAKENEDLFNKKMNKLRSDYKEFEIQAKEEEFQAAQQQAEQSRNEYIGSVVNASRGIKDFHDTIEIDDNDRNSLLEYIFDVDKNGVTQIQKALQDPANVIKVAWYLQHGDDTIKQVHQYYQAEIAKLSKTTKITKPETVIKQKPNQHTARHMTINDLY